MTIDELLAWKKAHQQTLTTILHQHREISGIHFMPGEGDAGSGAYVEISLKTETAESALAEELRGVLGDIAYQIVVLNPDEEIGGI